MQFSYFRPAHDVRDAIGSYYDVRLSSAFGDVMRAEIANVRFVLSGTVSSTITGELVEYKAPCVLLCGPTFAASRVHFTAGAHVFGAAITPRGWAQMAPSSAHHFADRVIDLDTELSGVNRDKFERVFCARSDEERVTAADEAFRSLKRPNSRIDNAFLDLATDWLTREGETELDDLLRAGDRSHRQIERLCKAYFGSAPKRLHRKFRALHAANRLAWNDLADWREVASTAYYDQAHFIREFKQFNGHTPSEFIRGPHILVRITLEERRKIVHHSPFSLIG